VVIQPSEQSFASGIELKCRRHGFRGVQSVGLGAIQQCWGLPVSYYDGHSCTASDLGTDPSNGLANVEPGDIVVHTVDGFNGNPALGIANILFTLPAATMECIKSAVPSGCRIVLWHSSSARLGIAGQWCRASVGLAERQYFAQ